MISCTWLWLIIILVIVGIVAALGIILLSPDMFVRYGLDAASATLRISQPGLISIPLSFITLVVVSLMTQKRTVTAAAAVSPAD